MIYPIYNKIDTRFFEQDGNYYANDFANFITQLVDGNVLENENEKRIVAFVDSNGTSMLTFNQSKGLERIIKRYENYRCNICNLSIPLNEVLYHDYNGGLCSCHKFQQDKEVNR